MCVCVCIPDPMSLPRHVQDWSQLPLGGGGMPDPRYLLGEWVYQRGYTGNMGIPERAGITGV